MGRIIRTCSITALALLASLVSPAVARSDAASPLSDYVRGRVAEAAGETGAAARAYGAALANDPADARIAARAYRQALRGGDRVLALRAALALDRAKKLTADARLLLFIDAAQRGDWRDARARLDAAEEQTSFDFLVPVLRAWVSYAERAPDPAAPLAQGQTSLAVPYAREHRALLLLVTRQQADGLTATRALATRDERGVPLRIAAASQLIESGNRAGALSLLIGDHPVISAARSRAQSGGTLPGAVTDLPLATGVLLARVAEDLLRDNAAVPGLTLARLASLAAPQRDDVRLTLARALLATGQFGGAQAVLGKVDPQGIWARSVNDERLATLLAAGEDAAALSLSTTVANAANSSDRDIIQRGDVLVRLGRDREAAAEYARATQRSEKDNAALWQRLGAAQLRGGDWPAAHVSLKRAAELAPESPAVLNYLGYSMLEQGEDVNAAIKLIAKASTLRPDDAAITDSLGWALFKRGETAEAIAVLERAAQSDPTEPTISEHLGDAYWRVGRFVDARYAWSAALIQADTADAPRITAKIADGPKASK